VPERVADPIVVDLGRIGQAEVERLREGNGQIADDVKEIMSLLSQKDWRGTNRVFVPVVTLYRREKKK
jgi:uncharacterized protein (UPF0335 family)